MRAKTSGFPLEHHNVFFAEDYAAEFDAIFKRRAICDATKVYICASATAKSGDLPETRDRLLILINAPAGQAMSDLNLEEVDWRAFGLLGSCGLQVKSDGAAITTPARFEQLFPGSGEALYGRANHGAFTSFQRPYAASRLPGLYLAGGTVHPGAGIPMATMSGKLAAARLLEDWAGSIPVDVAGCNAAARGKPPQRARSSQKASGGAMLPLRSAAAAGLTP